MVMVSVSRVDKQMDYVYINQSKEKKNTYGQVQVCSVREQKGERGLGVYLKCQQVIEKRWT